MVKIPEDVADVFNDDKTIKVLATLDETDVPHCVPIGSLYALSQEIIAFGVFMTEKTHSNLLHSQQTGKLASATVVSGMKSYQVKVWPKKYLTSGPIYEEFKKRLGALLAVSDLTLRGVWLLEPVEVYDQSPDQRAGQKLG